MIVWLRQVAMMSLKEVKQLLRDRPLLFFIIYIFTIDVILAASGRNTDIHNARVLVHDADHSEASRDLVSRFHSPYFLVVGEVADPKQGRDALQLGQAVLFIDIPEKFQKRLLSQTSPVDVQSLVDTSNATTGFLAASYAGRISAQFGSEWSRRAHPRQSDPRMPTIRNESRVRFNPESNNGWFIAIAELLTMMTVSCVLLPCAAMVREKERGTIEQLLVCPLSPAQIMLAKVIAMTTVMVVGTASTLFFIMHGMFGIPIRGNAAVFLLLVSLYAFANSGIGFLIATFSRNSAQSSMLLLLTAMPMVMLSGTWTPRESMPPLLQAVVSLFPMRHFIDITYGILMRGSTAGSLNAQVLWLAGLGVLYCGISLWRFRGQFK